MFKKPFSDIKTSAPLRSSDRRKLKQRVVETFALKDPEDGNVLVPEGLQSMKITTHNREPGILYLGPDGDPLWFTIGKGSDELIPTLYTLWKRPFVIPGWISTPGLVVPILAGGADLMVPGIVSLTPMTALTPGALVCITTYQDRARGPAFAVGRMAVHGAQIVSNQVTKGKAVTILHIFRDHLWMMGSKCQPPEPMPLTVNPTSKDEDGATVEEVTEGVDRVALENAKAAGEAPGDGNGEAQGDREASPSEDKLSPEEVSSALRSSLLQALQTSLSSLPASAFPIPATTFYTSHILPARPASLTPTTPIDIKHSTFKSLTAFLKQSEKQGLLRLKESKPDVSVAAVFPTHADIASHTLHRTVGDIDSKKRKEKERAEKKEQENEAKEHSLSVVELWKPHTVSLKFFEDLQMDTSALCTLADVKTALNKYIAAHDLVNKQEQQYINVGSDALLAAMLSSKKGAAAPEFAKREELLPALLERMQPWHRVQLGSSDPITKKGQLHPVSVVVKIRQGRKACTLITGFEPFQLESNTIAEALRARCASATAVTPVPGKSAGEEVMVQGKQIKPVVDYLLGEGVPKRWIEAADLSDAKKKK